MLAHLLLLLPMEQNRERVWFLYQKLKEKLMYAALQLLQQRDLAENAVEDAFLYLIHHFHELDTEDDQRVAAYLYQCVRHYALQELRRQKWEGSALEDETEDGMIGLEDRMIDMQRCAAVKAPRKTASAWWRSAPSAPYWRCWCWRCSLIPLPASMPLKRRRS